MEVIIMDGNTTIVVAIPSGIKTEVDFTDGFTRDDFEKLNQHIPPEKLEIFSKAFDSVSE